MKQQDLLKITDKPMLDRLYGFCYRRTSDHFEADALCSDILYAVVTAAQRTGEVSNPEAFLWKIAHNVYADFSERRRRRAETESVLDPDITPDDIPEEDEDALRQMREDQLSAIYRQISFLGRAYRNVMTAFYLENVPIAEIARRENTSVGAIKQRLFSAREKIKGEVTNMTTTNEKAMKLQTLHWNVWGTGNPTTGEAAKHCCRQFSRHLVWLCRKQARGAKELSELLCVPTSYVEEELEIQCFGASGYGMLRKTEDGKYISNVLMFDRAEIAAAQKIYLDRIPALCDIIVRYAMAHMDEYLSYPYLNKAVDKNLVLWRHVKNYAGKIESAVEEALDCVFADVEKPKQRPYSQFIFEQDPASRNWGGGCDGIGGSNIAGYSSLHLNNLYNSTLQAHFHCGHDIANDAPLLLAIRAVGGIATETLTENEKEHAAKAIQCGYLYRDGDMLYTKFLCEAMDEANSPTMANSALFDEITPLCREIAEELSVLLRRIIPAHLLGEYPFANMLAGVPLDDSVIETLIEKGLLTAPEGGIGAEGMWMMIQK